MSSSSLGLASMAGVSGLVDNVFSTGMSYGSVFTTAQAVENSVQSYAFGTDALRDLGGALDSASQSTDSSSWGRGTSSGGRSTSWGSSYSSSSSLPTDSGGYSYTSPDVDAYTRSVCDPISQYAETYGGQSSKPPSRSSSSYSSYGEDSSSPSTSYSSSSTPTSSSQYYSTPTSITYTRAPPNHPRPKFASSVKTPSGPEKDYSSYHRFCDRKVCRLSDIHCPARK